MTTRILVERARDLGPQFQDNPHRMVGQDGAYSIPLGDDSLWFFGDTLIGARVPGESLWYPGGRPVGHRDMAGRGSIDSMPNNTGLILEQTSGSKGLTRYRYICDERGNLRQLVPRLPDEHPDEVRVWCLHGIALKEKVYLYYITVAMVEEGPMPVNFALRGSGLAVSDRGRWAFRRIESRGSTLWWKNNQPQFGTAVLPDRYSDWLYVYGVIQDARGVQQCYLSRVHRGEIERLDAYEYYAGPGPEWSAEVDRAIPVMEGMPNEMSVSFNPWLNAFLAVHSQGISGVIVGRTAPEPWGPWSDPVPLWEVKVHREKPLPYPILIYAGKEHPELAGDNGRILYITYIEFEEYYPHLVEVTLGEAKG